MEEEASDSEAPRPISSRTRSRLVKKTKMPAVMLELDDVDDEDENKVDGAGAGATDQTDRLDPPAWDIGPHIGNM